MSASSWPADRDTNYDTPTEETEPLPDLRTTSLPDGTVEGCAEDYANRTGLRAGRGLFS